MYDVTEHCLSYTVLVSVIQSGAVVTRSNLSQIYTQHCTDSSRTEFRLEKHNRHQFLALTGEIWVVCCENLKKIYRVMAVPHCFNPFPVAFGALLWVSLSYDVTSVLMQSCLRTSEPDMLCLYALLCLVVTKKCKYGEIKLRGKKTRHRRCKKNKKNTENTNFVNNGFGLAPSWGYYVMFLGEYSWHCRPEKQITISW